LPPLHPSPRPRLSRASLTTNHVVADPRSGVKRHWFHSSTSFDWKQVTTQIIQSPVGSLTEETWEHAEEALQHWIQERENGVNASFQLMHRLAQEDLANLKFDSLNTVILNWKNAFLQQKTMILPSKVVQQLDTWRSHSPCIQPDTKTYTMILEAAASCVDNPSEGVLFAQDLLEWMLEESKTHSLIRPSTMSFGSVMHAWVLSGRSQAPQKIEEWLQRLLKLHDEGWSDLQPNTVIYNMLLNSYARVGKVDQAQKILDDMLEKGPVYPDQTSFTTVLHAHAKSQHAKAGERAEALLTRMQQLYQEGESSVKPNVLSYTSVMECWARGANGERAEQLLHHLEELYHETQDPDLQPDVPCYNTVLHAWSRSNKPQRADELLKTMFSEGNVDQRSFNIVLAAWAQFGDADKAEAILTRMHELAQEGLVDCRPSVVTYNTVLDSWTKSKQKNNWKRARDILNHMEQLYQTGDEQVQPNVRTWNTVLNCMAKSGKVDLAEDVMDQFTQAAKEGRTDGGPNVRTWNTLLAACIGKRDNNRVKQIFERMKESCKPDIVSYNTVINCCALSKDPDAGSHAEATFRQLAQDKSLQANRISFLGLLNTFINSNNMDKAEAVLMSMCKNQKVPADRELFHKVLAGWSHQRKPKRAETLLLTMVELHENQGLDVKPTADTYNRVLNCWAKANTTEAGERANLILREMEDLARAGDNAVKPNVISYNSVLNAWANSRDPTAVTRTEHLVLEMILKGNRDVWPTEVTYGTWLKAIASSSEDDKGRRAKEVLKTMKIHNMKPTNYILQTVDQLMSPPGGALQGEKPRPA
jgi:pentatricopeptide repeat protein